MTAAMVRRDFAVCTLGAQATLAQIVVIRAGLERFGGNEFFIGVALSAWLIAGAVGAAVFGRMADRPGRSRLLVQVGAFGAGFGVILSLLILRWLSVVLSAPGLALSPLAAAAWMAAAAAPAAMTSGVLFAWLVPVVSREFGNSLGMTTLLESLGAALGGFILGSVLIDLVGTPGLAAASIACGAGALLLSPPRATILRFAAVPAVLVLAAIGLMVADMPSVRDARVLSRMENRFGRFTAIESSGQVTVMDGVRPLVDCADRQTPELVAAVVSSFAPQARDIAVPAGGIADLSSLSSLPGRRVVLFTPDTDLQTFSVRACGIDASGRTVVRKGDPLRLLAQRSREDALSGHDGHDAILLNIGVPDTLNRSRMLGAEAFKSMKRALAPEGTLFVMLGHADVRPTPAETRVLAGIMNSAAAAFDDCRLLPIGNWWVVCGRQPTHVEDVIANAHALPLKRKFATDTFLSDGLEPFTLGRLERRMDAARAVTPISSVLKPSIQLDALMNWAAMHHPSAGTLKALPSPVTMYAVLALLPLLLLVSAPTRLLRSPRRWSWTIAALTGAAGMAAEIALMWTVESTWGALHLWLGGMIAAYMAGLGAGAYFARSGFGDSPAALEKAARISSLATGILVALSIPVCVGAARGLDGAAGMPLAMLILAACAAASGAAFQFAARRLWADRPGTPGGLTGAIRGIDAVAAGVAATLAPLVFIPLAGTTAVLTSCAISCAIVALHKSS